MIKNSHYITQVHGGNAEAYKDLYNREIIDKFILLFKRVIVISSTFYEYIKRVNIPSKEIVECRNLALDQRIEGFE